MLEIYSSFIKIQIFAEGCRVGKLSHLNVLANSKPCMRSSLRLWICCPWTIISWKTADRIFCFSVPLLQSDRVVHLFYSNNMWLNLNCIKYDSVTKVTDLKRCLQTGKKVWRLRLDRSMARYIYRAKENLLIKVLTCVQKTRYFFNWLKQILF